MVTSPRSRYFFGAEFSFDHHVHAFADGCECRGRKAEFDLFALLVAQHQSLAVILEFAFPGTDRVLA